METSEEKRRRTGLHGHDTEVIRTWLALAAFSTAALWGAGPSYSAANFVNASNYTAGPFAPNSVVSVFGTGLARSEHRLTETDLVACAASQLPARCLPLEMNFVRVYVRDQAVPILFVSQTQVNFLISSEAIAGPAAVRVVSEGITGPEVTVILADSAPALFATEGGYALATDANGVLLTPEAPAREGGQRSGLCHWFGLDPAESGARRDPSPRCPHAGDVLAQGHIKREAARSLAHQVCRRHTAVGRALPDQPLPSRRDGSRPRNPGDRRESGGAHRPQTARARRKLATFRPSVALKSIDSE